MASNIPDNVNYNDKDAPWNQPDIVECDKCHGDGYLPISGEWVKCGECDGQGFYDQQDGSDTEYEEGYF